MPGNCTKKSLIKSVKKEPAVVLYLSAEAPCQRLLTLINVDAFSRPWVMPQPVPAKTDTLVGSLEDVVATRWKQSLDHAKRRVIWGLTWVLRHRWVDGSQGDPAAHSSTSVHPDPPRVGSKPAGHLARHLPVAGSNSWPGLHRIFSHRNDLKVDKVDEIIITR